MRIKFYHIDTFTNKIFSGNPACVCLLPHSLSGEKLQAIAAENNLPVTTFLNIAGSQFNIRWFTAENELDLCGHGTLAAAFVIFKHINVTQAEAQLNSPKAGPLLVRQVGDIIEINFPRKEMTKLPASDVLIKGLGSTPLEVYQHKNERILAVLENESSIKNIKPNFDTLKSLEHRGLVVTAPSTTVDFISRTFYPRKAIPEDPVTGSSHCLLVPYWAKRLRKTKLHAQQISRRGGEVFCELKSNRILIGGKAVLYSEGIIFTDDA